MGGWFLVVSALLLSAAAAAFLAATRARPRSAAIHRRRLSALLGTAAPAGASLVPVWLARIGLRGAERDGGARESEARALLAAAGWYRSDLRILYHAATVLLPLVGGLLGGLAALGTGLLGARGFALVFLGFGAGVLGPRYLLRYLAARRRRLIAEEVPVMVRVLGLLCQSGLSLEHALEVIREEAGELIPHLAGELERMLHLVGAGMDLVEAMEQTARQVDVQELTDALNVLAQAARYGGGVRQSLTRLAALLDDTRRTSLRERVGRLSGKMTVVMVVFLFPALLIFLAGPGMLAIAGALERVQ